MIKLKTSLPSAIKFLYPSQRQSKSVYLLVHYLQSLDLVALLTISMLTLTQNHVFDLTLKVYFRNQTSMNLYVLYVLII